MTRTKATVSLFVFCALLVPLLLAPGPLAAKTHATKSRAKPVAAKSVKTAVGSPEMAEKAKNIGAAMAGENGVQTAVKIINEKFGG